MINHNLQLKKILIKNFRGFDELEIKFGSDNYYSLVGKNGIGKTGILEAINIALSDNSSKFNNIAETDFYSEDPIEIEIEFTNYFFFIFNEKEDRYDRLIPCKKFKKTIDRRDRKEMNSLFSPPYEIKYDYNIENFSPTKDVFDNLKTFIQTNLSSNYQLVRQLKLTDEGSFEYMRESDNGTLNWRSIDLGYGINYLNKVLFPKIFYFDKDRSRELLDQYNTTLSRVINELNWRLKREIRKLASDDEKKFKDKYSELHTGIKELDTHKAELFDPVISIVKEKLGISVVDQGLDFYFMDVLNPYKGSLLGHRTTKEQFVPVMNYGSGVTSLISLTFLIEYAKLAKECIIVLIDEPEIHLHPELAKKLKKILKDSSFQFILSTHSHLFLDKEKCSNNICLYHKDTSKIYVKCCNQIDLADVQFKLLGNSLDDLYIPFKLLLVEGKYDKHVLTECLTQLGLGHLALQILDCEGYTNIPEKAERYTKAIDDIKKGTENYKEYIKQDTLILVDGDVSDDTVKGWITSYDLTKDKVKHLDNSCKSLEYTYPESLVKELVNEVELDDNTYLKDYSKTEIITIILEDDDKNKDYKQIINRVSKSRLNTYIAENISEEILKSNESEKLYEVLKWIATNNDEELY